LDKSFFDFELFAAPEGSASLKKVRGQGRAGILVLFIPQGDGSQDEDYLAAILKPLNFNLQTDTFILPLPENEPVPIVAFIKKLDPKVILLFGCNPKDCGIRIALPEYEPVKFTGKCFLRADTLHRIRTDRENNDNRRAGALWAALKKIFS